MRKEKNNNSPELLEGYWLLQHPKNILKNDSEKFDLVRRHTGQSYTNIYFNEANFQSIDIKEHICMSFFINHGYN